MSKTESIRNCPDGTECTEHFCTYKYNEVPAEWADQRGERATRMLLHKVLVDGVPCEGGCFKDGHNVSFYDDVHGIGYTMTYEVGEPDELGFVTVTNVRVYRNSAFDRKEGDATKPFEISECEDVETPLEPKDAITFDNHEEYEAQCERMRQSGIDDASRAVWEAVKTDAERFWKVENMIRDRAASPARDLRATNHNKRFSVVLDTYTKAFAAMGCALTYEQDWSDPCERIHTIKATGIYGNTIGYLRDLGHDKWWA